MPHLRKIASRRPSRIACRRTAFIRSRESGALGSEDADVVADARRCGGWFTRPGLRRTPRAASTVVQQHGIHAAERQVAIGVHVVLVGHRHDAVRLPASTAGCRRPAWLPASPRGGPPDRRACDTLAPSDCPHREDLAELVVGNRDRQAGAARGRVFDAAQADVEVAARGGRVEAREADLDEPRRAAEPIARAAARFHLEADDPRRIVRVGLDERRAAFGIAAPAQLRDGLRRRRTAMAATSSTTPDRTAQSRAGSFDWTRQ